MPETRPERLVIISRLGPFHLPVVKALKERFPNHLLIRPISSRVPRSSLGEKLRRFIRSPIHTLVSKADQVARDRYERKRLETIKGILAGDSSDDIPVHHIIEKEEINSEVTRQIIKEFSPDLLVTSGAPILTEEIFSLPKIAALNVHYGVSSFYRGEHCLHWAYSENRPEGLGLTIHRIDEGTDTGAVYAYGFPELVGDENEFIIQAKCIELAPYVLLSVLDRLASGERPKKEKFSTSAKLVRYRDLTLCNLLGSAANQDLPARPEKVQLFL